MDEKDLAPNEVPEQLMDFGFQPKKIGKKPVLTNKKKPKEEEAENKPTEDKKDEEEMQFDFGGAKTGKKPNLPERKKNIDAQKNIKQEQEHSSE